MKHDTGRSPQKQAWIPLLVALCAGGLFNATPAAAQPPAPARADLETGRALSFEANGEAFRIAIAQPAGQPVAAQQDGQELLLRFPRALPPVDALALQAQAQRWVGGVSVGYDSMLLLLLPGVVAQTADEAGRLVVTLRPQVQAPAEALALAPGPAQLQAQQTQPPQPQASTTSAGPADEPAQDGGAQRLDLLAAQLLLRQGRLGEARQRFASLHERLPDSPEPLAGLAAIEQQSGRWRKSLALYERAAAAGAGDDAPYAPAVQAIERSQAPRVRFDAEHRRVDGGETAAQVRLTLLQARGDQRLNEAWRAGAAVDGARVRTDKVQRSSGVVEPFSGQRTRGELFVQHDSLEGTAVVGSLFGGNGASPGAGVLVRRPDDLGHFTVQGEFHRPNWDYVEGVIDDATRDRLAAGRLQRFGGGVTGRLEGGFNRYNVRGASDAVRTWSLIGELRLDGVAGVRGLSAVYNVDAEYVDRRIERTNAAGASYRPFALQSREVHSATLAYGAPLPLAGRQDRLSFHGYAGYAADRYGNSGPLAGGSLRYAEGPVEVVLRAGYARVARNAESSFRTVGAFVVVAF